MRRDEDVKKKITDGGRLRVGDDDFCTQRRIGYEEYMTFFCVKVSLRKCEYDGGSE